MLWRSNTERVRCPRVPPRRLPGPHPPRPAAHGDPEPRAGGGAREGAPPGCPPEEAWNYCTYLFAADANKEVDYLGRGTFVQWGEHGCLLTAAHVWEQLGTCNRIGFNIRDGMEAYVVGRRGDLKILHCSPKPADGRWTEWGPDLTLIELPSKVVGALGAKGKAFYNLV